MTMQPTIDGATIRPLRDLVVVRKDDYETKTKSGLVLPDVAQMRPRQGTVLAVGPGRVIDDRLVPLAVAPGDHVAFGNFAGNEVDPKDELLVLMKEEEIFCVLGS